MEAASPKASSGINSKHLQIILGNREASVGQVSSKPAETKRYLSSVIYICTLTLLAP